MNGPPLEILHVLAPADVGGLESVVLALAAGHAAQGHSVRIAAVMDRATNQFVVDARATGLDVEIINSPPRSVRPERDAIRRLLQRHQFHVLHSHGYRSDVLNLGIARRMGVPTVSTLHGFSATDWKARAYEWLQLRGVRRASAVVAVSANVSRRVADSGVAPTSVHLIPNALGADPGFLSSYDARASLGLGSDINIAWVGRMSAEKAPDVMLEAMTHIRDLDLMLSFIGDGPARQALAARAVELGVADRVRFHGNVPRASRLLRAFDLLVLSSRAEGTPMILLEAMRASVPIVATRVGGVPDMLTTDQARLVDPEKPRVLALAIRDALADPDASRARAAKALDRLTRDFDSTRWLQRYEQLYRSIQPHQRGSRQ